MKPVQALFFDLDDTLLDGSGNQEAIIRAWPRSQRPGPAWTPLDCWRRTTKRGSATGRRSRRSGRLTAPL